MPTCKALWYNRNPAPTLFLGWTGMSSGRRLPGKPGLAHTPILAQSTPKLTLRVSNSLRA